MSNNNRKNKDRKTKDRLNNYARFSGVAFQMMATIGLGVFIGVKLDDKFPNQYQLYTIIFSFLFIGIALYSVIRQVSKNDKD